MPNETTVRAPATVMLAQVDIALTDDIAAGCERTTIDIYFVQALLRFAMDHGATTVGELYQDD